MEWVREELTRHWGRAQIWSIGRMFQADALPGFVAQMNVTLVVVALYAVNIWLRLGDPNLAIAITLSLIGVGMLAASSWLETQLLRVNGKR